LKEGEEEEEGGGGGGGGGGGVGFQMVLYVEGRRAKGPEWRGGGALVASIEL